MPDDPEVLNIVEILKLNVPMAIKIALDGLLHSNYSTRDTSISDVGKYEKVEVSVMLFNDNFIQNLNKEWTGEDCTTDMLSMSQYDPDLDVPILMLGDIVISVETTARQAEERGHTLLDEMRILVGLLVYGLEGREIYKRNLDQEVCSELFLYSLEHKVPLVAFSQDQCFSMFDDPLVDSHHYIYHEHRAEVVSSIDQLLGKAETQKVLFLETPEGISSTLRPYWAKATEGRARVVQAQLDMLELVPPATSKGNGLKVLLDHLCISPDEVMAIGDGENDIEMLYN